MVRLLQVFLVFIIGISISSPCCAGIKIGGKKAETRAQQKARNNIDEMVSAAESFLQVEDSFDRAIKILKEAYFQSNQDNYTIGIIKSANLLADGYLYLVDYSNATSKYYIAMRHAESIGDSVSMAKAYRGLGLVKFNMKQWADAISNFNTSRDFNALSNQVKVTSLIDYLLGLSYYHLGKYEIAEQSLLTARQAASVTWNSMRLLEIDLNLTNVLVERTNQPSVLIKYDSLHDIFKQLPSKHFVVKHVITAYRLLFKFRFSRNKVDRQKHNKQ